MTHATAMRLETDGAGARRWSVRARHVALAAGAVENARLLLASGDAPTGLGNESGWVGRCFMEHPRDTALALVPRSAALYREAAFYDLHLADGAAILGRIGLADDAVRSGRLPNASATLVPRSRPWARGLRRAVGAAGPRLRADRWLPGAGHGWSRHPRPAWVFDGFTVLLNIEQAPHPENRVRLGNRLDALGTPLPELHWRWRGEDQQRLDRLRAVFARELDGARLGRVEVMAAARVDPNGHHHAGTTRMHADPQRGVVDADGRVHSLDNLFVVGASVFPTAGFANPVLTIVALTLRLADRLRRAI